MKKCFVCNEIKTIDQFNNDSDHKDGKSYKCKDCNNIASKNYRKKNLKKCLKTCSKYYTDNRESLLINMRERRIQCVNWFKNLKDNQLCLDCKQPYSHYILEYDHLDPTTKVRAVSHLIEGDKEKVLAEIAKCDLVCRNCHKARTYSRKSHPKYPTQKTLNYRAAKEASPCSDCNKFYPFYIMEYDHLDSSSKKNHVSLLVDCSSERLQEEIAKCDLVCSNCHSARTYLRKHSS
jgi:hypothetical protein